MSEPADAKPYDLEELTFMYAKEIITFINTCSKTMVNSELARQLVRSSGSVGANYIEAREALSRKDFLMRVKICRKEAKESVFWLKLLEVKDGSLDKEETVSS